MCKLNYVASLLLIVISLMNGCTGETNECTSEDVLQLTDSGYSKNEIDGICNNNSLVDHSNEVSEKSKLIDNRIFPNFSRMEFIGEFKDGEQIGHFTLSRKGVLGYKDNMVVENSNDTSCYIWKNDKVELVACMDEESGINVNSILVKNGKIILRDILGRGNLQDYYTGNIPYINTRAPREWLNRMCEMRSDWCAVSGGLHHLGSPYVSEDGRKLIISANYLAESALTLFVDINDGIAKIIPNPAELIPGGEEAGLIGGPSFTTSDGKKLAASLTTTKNGDLVIQYKLQCYPAPGIEEKCLSIVAERVKYDPRFNPLYINRSYPVIDGGCCIEAYYNMNTATIRYPSIGVKLEKF